MKEFITGRTGNPKMDELKKYIYAHRGYHAKPSVPENSLPAFQRAVERGFGIELDIHLTKDDKLVVFHDSDLKRITGQEGILEEKTWEELSAYRLEGTEERMPLFDEVLELCENRIPMIIELKSHGRIRELAAKACERLKTYKGLYCIESFDPMIMAEVRKRNPEIVRGQLWTDFVKEKEKSISWIRRILLTELVTDVYSKPDFIAYKFSERGHSAVQKVISKGITEVAWTIRNPEDFKTCRTKGIVPIFECFDPEKS